ncbi:hypothetical protein [Anaerofustis stercorihominis]|uniref:hypothetical protein n=1 Tax=Anaerofustis stercorihominis TaxID=214853 RepID=UPI00398414CA
MKKSEAKEIAKDILHNVIGCAYYRLEGIDGEKYSEEEKHLICSYITKYGTSACKAFGREYISF